MTGPAPAASVLAQGLALLLLSACAPTGPLHFKPERYRPLGLEVESAGILLVDARPGAAPLTLKGASRKEGTLAAALAPGDSAAVLAQVGRNLTGEGPAMQFRVAVERADVSVRKGFRIEGRVESKVRIGIHQGASTLAECTGQGFLETRAGFLRESTLKTLFREALEMAVYGCLESTKEELPKYFRAAPRGRI